MKVKVQYTVDLDKDPAATTRLLPKLLDLPPEIGHIENLLSHGNIVNALETIDSTRKPLYIADQRLADCVSILEGYLGVKSSPSQPQEEAQDDSVS